MKALAKALLKQNSKMLKSSDGSSVVYNFGIPAFISEAGIRTCPNAGVCASGCYARGGAYLYPNAKKSYESRLTATMQDNFADIIKAELTLITLKNKNKKVYIRIHDAGDFYNRDYLNKWITVMHAFPQVTFYAYTKQVSMFKAIELRDTKLGGFKVLPDNFIYIFSFGGKEDHLIDVRNDRHSVVFESTSKLEAYGYVNASDNDLLAIVENKKVGLHFHHQKAYRNTQWSKVSVLNNSNESEAVA